MPRSGFKDERQQINSWRLFYFALAEIQKRAENVCAVYNKQSMTETGIPTGLLSSKVRSWICWTCWVCPKSITAPMMNNQLFSLKDRVLLLAHYRRFWIREILSKGWKLSTAQSAQKAHENMTSHWFSTSYLTPGKPRPQWQNCHRGQEMVSPCRYKTATNE